MKGSRAETGVAPNLSLARQTVAIRYWQHLLNERLKTKPFAIPVHLAFGHEAIAVAVNEAMSAHDQLVLTHRNIAYNLARAGAPDALVSEFLGEADGLANGRLGSMNLANPARGIPYTSSILANNIGVACGLALAHQLNRTGGVVTVLSGDGAMEEGQFYEGLVFSRTHRLPLVVIVENNDQSMASTIAERRIPIFTERLAAAVGMPFHSLTGNDVFAYTNALARVRQQVVEEATPVCLEVELTAMYAHAGPTPGWPADPKNISLERGLIVEESPNDPLFVVRERIGQDEFDALCADIRLRPVQV